MWIYSKILNDLFKPYINQPFTLYYSPVLTSKSWSILKSSILCVASFSILTSNSITLWSESNLFVNNYSAYNECKISNIVYKIVMYAIWSFRTPFKYTPNQFCVCRNVDLVVGNRAAQQTNRRRRRLRRQPRRCHRRTATSRRPIGAAQSTPDEPTRRRRRGQRRRRRRGAFACRRFKECGRRSRLGAASCEPPTSRCLPLLQRHLRLFI